MSTISLLEVAWCLPLIPGLIASSLTLRDTWVEERAATTRYGADTPEAFTARTTFIFESLRWVQQFALLAVGLYFMAEPEQPHVPGYGMIVALLLLFDYLLAFNSVFTRYFRYRVIQLMRRVRDEKEGSR
jgi:hypothetical protein